MNKFDEVIKAGDQIVLQSGRVNRTNCSITFTALADQYIRRTNKNPKGKCFVMVTDGSSTPFEMERSVVRHLKQSDLDVFNEIKDRIEYLLEIEDENQHISSVSNEPKVEHCNEMKAWESAYRMAKQQNGIWIYYKCNVCNKWHVGKKRTVEASKENLELEFKYLCKDGTWQQCNALAIEHMKVILKIKDLQYSKNENYVNKEQNL